MNDPYMLEFKSYLRKLEQSAETRKLRPYEKDDGRELGYQLRAMTCVGVVIMVVAFTPWGIL